MRNVAIFLALAAVAAAQDRTISSDADVRWLAFSKDGVTLSGVCSDNKLRQWDARSGALRNTTGWATDERAAALHSASGLLALGGRGSVALLEAASGTPVRKIPIGDRRVGQVAVAYDGQAVAGSSRVAGNSRDEMMRLWDASGKQNFEVPSGIGGTSTLAISPDGSVLVAGSYDTNIRVWSTRNGELVKLIEDIPVSMFGLVFSPDGKTLAAGGADRTVYFWDAKTWKPLRKLTGQPEMISAIAFSGDGRLLATGGFNDITQKMAVSILVWDVASGKVLQRLPAPHRVSSVAFAPDGKLIAATGGDKTVRLWAIR